MNFGYVYAIILMQSLVLCGMDQQIKKQIDELKNRMKNLEKTSPEKEKEKN